MQKKRKKIPHHREYFIGEEIQTRFPWEMPFKLNIDAFNRGFFFFFFFPPQFNANPFSSPLRKLDRTLGFFFFLISVSGRIGGKILSPLLVFTCQRESNHFWKDSRSPLCAPGIYTLPLGKKSSNITVNAASSLPSPLSGSRAPQLKVLPITGCTPGDLETTDPAKLLSAPMKR